MDVSQLPTVLEKNGKCGTKVKKQKKWRDKVAEIEKMEEILIKKKRKIEIENSRERTELFRKRRKRKKRGRKGFPK